MNLIFSFDSIVLALAITDVFAVLASAIGIPGLAVLLLADHVPTFLQHNREYEVLGLFIFLIVGIGVSSPALPELEIQTEGVALADGEVRD